MNKQLVLETTAPFQGLAELVAFNEGLFAKEGLDIKWADRDRDVDKTPQLHVTSHKGVNPFSSHGKLLEEGKADLYNACEWGNYSRVESPRSAADRSAAAQSSLSRPSSCGRIRRSRRRSNSRTDRSACPFSSARIT